MFSFNSPFGACPDCGGLGTKMEIDPDLIVPDPVKNFNQGVIAPWGLPRGGWQEYMMRALMNRYGFTLITPFRQLAPEIQKVILYGSGDDKIQIRWEHRHRQGVSEIETRFEGVIPNLNRRYRQTQSSGIREWIQQYMSVKPCLECKGARLKKESLAVRIDGRNIADLTKMAVKSSY